MSETPNAPETPQTSRQERETEMTARPEVVPSTSREADFREIDLEKDAETSGKAPGSTEEPTPEAEKADSYQRYMMTGKGDTQEQKVNEVVKDLYYHNMVVVRAVGDKMIN